MYPGKRLIDILFSIIGFVIFSPVWLVMSLLILLLDGRPILFSQERIGMNQKPITILKFRTMTDEHKITRTGDWIRKTGLDESLQFLSVIKGDMSLIGPRPITASDIEKLGWGVGWLNWRWSVKPGITGYAQLFEPLANRISLAKDRYLIRYGSAIGDIGILVMTFLINSVGKQRGRQVLSWHRMNK
jgi:lipopolysaccharide/colanic/teichoic acid biosynthesis glycosyltransferase